MPYVVTCTFREPVKSYHMDPGDLELRAGDRVVAETSRGLEIGSVKFQARQVGEDKIAGPVRRVLRAATPEDLAQQEGNLALESEALSYIRAKIASHRLEMKPVSAEVTLDRSKLFFFYESEGRVDFRDLLRDVSAGLGIRLQFLQVNAREAAKQLGGCGPCGKELCCSTFLTSMPPVTLKMAKEQGLALTPNKISGSCGRLMCCLRYEVEFYRDQKLRLPRAGSPVDTPEGPGHVVEVNLVSEKCTVELGDGRRIAVQGEVLRSLREERGEPRGCSNHISQGGSCSRSASASAATEHAPQDTSASDQAERESIALTPSASSPGLPHERGGPKREPRRRERIWKKGS
jgi:cell fate regulator YaaT (PSP1 superfamily)